MENLPVEIKFAQNLAGNETKNRLKAVKKLKKYLRVKSASKKDGFSYEDFLKLWKGLHYCMWMQDKPLLQEELSVTLTKLVHDLSTLEAQMMFVKVFFITEAREWNSIDVWRIDKFMMMVRNMLFESLILLKKLKWDHSKLERLTEVFYEAVMNPDTDTIPDGLKIHFCDIYLEEVEKASAGQLTGSQLLQLLVPFIKFMKRAKNATLLKRVVSCVFDPVITRVATEVKLKQTGNKDGGDTEDIPFLTLKFDGKVISDHIFGVSQEGDVLSRNRPMLYGIVKRLQDIEEGALPQQKEIVIQEGVTSQDVREAVNSLMNLDIKDRKKKLRKKKNKKEKHEDSGANENADPNNNSAGGDDVSEMIEMPSASGIGGKRKHSATEDSEPLTKIKKKKLEADSKSENTVTEKKTFKKLKNKFSKLDVIKSKKDKKLKVQDKTEVVAQSVKSNKSNIVNKPVTEMSFVPLNKAHKTETSNAVNKEVFTITADVPATMKKSTDKKTPDTLMRKGKRTHSQIENSSTNDMSMSGPGASKTPDIVIQQATPSVKSVTRSVKSVTPSVQSVTPSVKSGTPSVKPGTPSVKSGTLSVKSGTPSVKPVTSSVKSHTPSGKSPANTENLQNGEIEIWVPNKKYKGNQDTTTPKSAIAAFDNSKPPAAFVKRSLSKSLKKTPSSMKTPGSGGKTGSAKRVSFDMKKNKAQGFKESLNSPMTPYNPSKVPDSGILKSPASALAGQGQSSKRAAKNSNSTPETPITRQTVSAKKKMATPVVSIGFERKKVTPMRRKHAADFFL